jgi:recombination protein RecA
MIKTGSIGIDIALGGGWPPGIHDLWGDSGAGKTTVALHAAENVTRAGGNVVWVDTAGGVAHMDNAPRVIVCRPKYAEDVFMVTNAACAEESIGLIVIDSANMLVRERELNDPAYVPHPQREYKDELTELKRLARASGTTVLFVSQPRDKQREPVRGTGISEKAGFRVHLHPDVVHQDGTREIQATVKDVPGKTVTHDAARFTIRPGAGIDQALELVHEAIARGVLVPSGSWLVYDHVRVQGARAMARVVGGNSRMTHELDRAIRRSAGIA